MDNSRQEPDEEDEEHDAAARAVLDESCALLQLKEICGGLGPLTVTRECSTKKGAIGVIVTRLRDEVSGLQAVWKSNSTQFCPRGRVW